MHVDISQDIYHPYTYMYKKDRRGTGNEKEKIVKNMEGKETKIKDNKWRNTEDRKTEVQK
jgi:hypothetical protein